MLIFDWRASNQSNCSSFNRSLAERLFGHQYAPVCRLAVDCVGQTAPWCCWGAEQWGHRPDRQKACSRLQSKRKVLWRNLPLCTQGLLVWTKRNCPLTWIFAFSASLVSLKVDKKGHRTQLVFESLHALYHCQFCNQAGRVCHLLFALWPAETRVCSRRAYSCVSKHIAAFRLYVVWNSIGSVCTPSGKTQRLL